MEYFYTSPLGLIRLVSESGCIVRLNFAEGAGPPNNAAPDGVTALCVRELDGYFKGALKVFSVPVKFGGTAFQSSVWEGLRGIPYGQTRSYKQLAAYIGRPNATRAVGGANHRNPVWIILPCHRVIGADGSLTGYGGGLWRKEWLLNHEKKHLGE